MKRKIRKRCRCGCGEITNPGRKYIHNHHWLGRKHTAKTKLKISLAWRHRVVSAETKLKISKAAQNMSEEHKRKISLAHQGKKHSEETKEKMSKAQQGRKHTAETIKKISEAKQGKKHSAETKLKISLTSMKYDPDNPYCDVWKSREYKNDIRKNYCENMDCKKTSKQLQNHHIHLDKKKCAPIDIMTMCASCHIILHRKLERGNKSSADPNDFIIINRPNHVSYIHKKSRKIIIRINKKEIQNG